MQDKQLQDENFIIVESLTRRENEVLTLLAERLTNAEIAEHLTLALSTVKGYTHEIYGKLGVNSRKEAVHQAHQLGLLAEDQPSQLPADNLPVEITPFVGRVEEIEQITDLLAEPTCRLVSLFGPGGIGKSRLAVQIARRMVDQSAELFPDGIFFVPLASLSKAEFIPLAVSSTLNIELDSGDDSHKQLIQFLKMKEMLLIFDNFEHLWDEQSADLLGEILWSAPGIKMLVTARERLNLHGEQSFSLPGLDVPSKEQLRAWDNGRAEGENFSSIQLFIQSARRVQADFQLHPDQVPATVEICRLLGGLPLGIEMAAAWVPVLSPTQFLTEFRSGLYFLQAETYGMPKRQQRMMNVLENSWKRLSEAERSGVKALSVFPGSFDLSTARQVHPMTPDLLRSLVDKSWLQPIEQGRFQMHALLHHYASSRLAGEPHLRKMFKDRHSRYFCEFLERLDADWSGPYQATAIAEIKREIDNIRAAWDWAVEHRRIDLLARGRYSLETFYEWTGMQKEGQGAFMMAASSLIRETPLEAMSDPTRLRLLAELWATQSHFTSGSQAGIQLLERCETILARPELQASDLRCVRARVLELYGQHWASTDRELARNYLQQSYAAYQEINDTTSESRLLSQLAWISWVTGDHERSRQLIQENLEMQESRGDSRAVGFSLNLLGKVLKHLGELDEAERLHRASVTRLQEAGAEKDAARKLLDLANTLAWNGKFREAMRTSEECHRIFEKLGLESEKIHGAISFAPLHLGRYKEAEEWAIQQQDITLAASRWQNYGFALLYSGQAALALGKLEEARSLFLESYAVLDSLQHNMAILPRIFLGHVERAQGNPTAAWNYLEESFSGILASRSFFPLLRSLPLIAMLLLDQGETEQAVEIYTFARRYRLISASRWFQDIAGEELDREAARLAKECLKALQARAQTQDPWQTAERLQAAIPDWAAKSRDSST